MARPTAWADLFEVPSASVLSLSSASSSGTVVVRVYHDAGNIHLLGIQTQQDELLSRVSANLAAVADDLAGRYGGEEFLVLFESTNLPEASEVAERMRAAIEISCQVPDGTPVTVSIGVAERHPGEALDATVARADQSLYLAKQAGRNRVVAAAG